MIEKITNPVRIPLISSEVAVYENLFLHITFPLSQFSLSKKTQKNP